MLRHCKQVSPAKPKRESFLTDAAGRLCDVQKAHTADAWQVQLPLLLAEGPIAECRIDADDRPEANLVSWLVG